MENNTKLKIVIPFLLFGFGVMSIPTFSGDKYVYIPPEAKQWKVKPTYFHAVPEQTDSRFWETKDGTDIRTLNLYDTTYIAVPQSKWNKTRKFRYCAINNKPCKVIDVLNRRYNRHDRIDVLVPENESYPEDSIIVEFF